MCHLNQPLPASTPPLRLTQPVGTVEAFVACAAKNAVDTNAGLIVAFSEGGKTMRLAAKYRPGVPVMVVTANARLARQCSAVYGLFPYLLDAPLLCVADVPAVVELAVAEAVNMRPPLCPTGVEVIVMGATCVLRDGSRVTPTGAAAAAAAVMAAAAAASAAVFGAPAPPPPQPSPSAAPAPSAWEGGELEPLPERQMYFVQAPGHLSVPAVDSTTPARYTAKTLSLRATSISLAMVTSASAPPRKTKIIVTLGAKCWRAAQWAAPATPRLGAHPPARPPAPPPPRSEEGMAAMIDAGASVGKVVFKGEEDKRGEQKALLARWARVAASKGLPASCMLDTLGPQVRTGGLTDHMPLTLTRGGLVTLVADPAFVGFRNVTETRVGVSYPALATTVVPGSRILLAYGALELVVDSVPSESEVVCRVVNTSVLAEHTAVYLPGAFVDLPVLTQADVADVRFGVNHGVTCVALSFVQSADDVAAVRAVLEEEGAEHVRVFAKIENLVGVRAAAAGQGGGGGGEGRGVRACVRAPHPRRVPTLRPLPAPTGAQRGRDPGRVGRADGGPRGPGHGHPAGEGE